MRKAIFVVAIIAIICALTDMSYRDGKDSARAAQATRSGQTRDDKEDYSRIVYVTTTDKHYHLSSCRSLGDSKGVTLYEAREMGRDACLQCMP